jgi:hypothetical protein
LETIRITLRTSNTQGLSSRANSDPSVALVHDFRVPADGTFFQLRHDYESQEWGYKPRSARPGSTESAGPELVGFEPFNGEDFVPLTEEMQWFHLALLGKANPSLSTDELKARWRALTVNCVVFTDGHYIDYGTRYGGNDLTKNYADYILGMNLDNPVPIAWKALSTGGNLVKVISPPTTIEAIDFTKPLPSIEEVWQKPWLIHWATAQTLDLLPVTTAIDGVQRPEWRVSPFPQMQPVGTPFPIWGRGGKNQIASAASMKSIANGEIFSPYVP